MGAAQIEWRFDSTAERDEFVEQHFPGRRGLESPGAYALHDGGLLCVFCETVRYVGPDPSSARFTWTARIEVKFQAESYREACEAVEELGGEIMHADSCDVLEVQGGGDVILVADSGPGSSGPSLAELHSWATAWQAVAAVADDESASGADVAAVVFNEQEKLR
jgi:hypothetical protein